MHILVSSVKQPPLVRPIPLVPVDNAVKALPHTQYVICLDELQIVDPRFCSCKALVLLNHRRQTPILQFSQTTHKTACPVLQFKRTEPNEQIIQSNKQEFKLQGS